MIDHQKARITGVPVEWVAVPDGYRPHGEPDRVATGNSEALAMLRDAVKEMGNLPPVGYGECVFRVAYSPVFADDGSIRREIDALRRDGEKYGVQCFPTTQVTPR